MNDPNTKKPRNAYSKYWNISKIKVGCNFVVNRKFSGINGEYKRKDIKLLVTQN